MAELAIAFLQLKPGGSREENLNKGLEACRRAREMGADLALFPEMWSNGYHVPEHPTPQWKEEAVSGDGPFVEAFGRLAGELGMAIGITFLEAWGEQPRNTLVLFDRFGARRLTYAKVHTCDFGAERSLTPGDNFFVAELDTAQGPLRVGAMICYDREYPESARVLMLKGAEIILVPNDCGSMQPRLQALSTRAYENMVGVVMANPPGEEKGNSCAYSPICWDRDGHCADNQILLADSHSQGIYYADFDLKELRRYRSQEMMGNTFRKVGAYEKLLDSEVAPPFCRSRQEECCKNGENPL